MLLSRIVPLSATRRGRSRTVQLRVKLGRIRSGFSVLLKSVGRRSLGGRSSCGYTYEICFVLSGFKVFWGGQIHVFPWVLG